MRLRALARELQRNGMAVEVLTAMPNYPDGRTFDGYTGRVLMTERIDGIRVRRTWVSAGTGRSAFTRLRNYLSFTATALVAALTGPRPDVLFVESQPLSLGVIALLMKWLRGVPYVYNVPDLQVDVARQLGFIRNEVVLHAASVMETLFVRQARCVAVVTERFRDHFVARGVAADRVIFMPNGADTALLRPEPPCVALLDRWALHDKKVFVYYGTHAYYHGLGTLIAAAARLRHRPDIVFLMVGSGPERARLEAESARLCLPNVIFGGIRPDEATALHSIAWAALATLRDVPVARTMRLAKIFPALSCGVPVIHAAHGEGAELLTRNACGIVVPPEDPAMLADAIIQLADDRVLRDLLGRNGRSFVEREYDWRTIVARGLARIMPQLRDERFVLSDAVAESQS